MPNPFAFLGNIVKSAGQSTIDSAVAGGATAVVAPLLGPMVGVTSAPTAMQRLYLAGLVSASSFVSEMVVARLM